MALDPLTIRLHDEASSAINDLRELAKKLNGLQVVERLERLEREVTALRTEVGSVGYYSRNGFNGRLAP